MSESDSQKEQEKKPEVSNNSEHTDQSDSKDNSGNENTEPKMPPGVVYVPLHRVKGFGHGPTVVQGPHHIRVGGVQKPELGPKAPFDEKHHGLIDMSHEDKK